MDQGQIVCSFCSAQFTVPPGLNEAICPKCGKAMPLFNTTLGVGQEDGLPPAAEEEEIWDTVEDFQETPAPAPDDNDVVGRIALKQVPADQLQPPQKTMMGQGAPSQPGLSSLATTDDDGQLIPDVIHAGDGAQAAPTPSNGGQAPGGGSFLDSGFDLGPENPEMEGASGVRTMSGLDSGAPPPPAGGMPNLLDELDAELDNALPEDEEEIPEAEPLIEMDHEVEDFFESEQTPGLVLPDDGAIAVSIPEAPIQERMRSEAVSVSTSNMEAVGVEGDSVGAEEKSALDAGVTPDLTPVLRLAIFIGLGVGVMLLIGLLYWLIQ